MEPMREEDPLPEHPLVSSCKLDFGDRESMPKVQRSVHVRVWERSKPLRILFAYLRRRQLCRLLWRRCLYFEETLFLPASLIFLFEVNQKISLARLESCRVYENSVYTVTKRCQRTWASSIVADMLRRAGVEGVIVQGAWGRPRSLDNARRLTRPNPIKNMV